MFFHLLSIAHYYILSCRPYRYEREKGRCFGVRAARSSGEKVLFDNLHRICIVQNIDLLRCMPLDKYGRGLAAWFYGIIFILRQWGNYMDLVLSAIIRGSVMSTFGRDIGVMQSTQLVLYLSLFIREHKALDILIDLIARLRRYAWWWVRRAF